MRENEIATQVVDAAYHVHKRLGPGLLKTVYEIVLAYELRKRGLHVARQLAVPIEYDSMTFDEGFCARIVVDDKVILELKSVETVAKVYKKQLLTYLRLADKRLGLLINFGEELIRRRHIEGRQWIGRGAKLVRTTQGAHAKARSAKATKDEEMQKRRGRRTYLHSLLHSRLCVSRSPKPERVSCHEVFPCPPSCLPACCWPQRVRSPTISRPSFAIRPPPPGRGSIGSGSTATSPARASRRTWRPCSARASAACSSWRSTRAIPTGPCPFAGPPWRELFKHVVAEAGRLGMEVNMNNDAGWTGSGGPWITPEHAMQRSSGPRRPSKGPRRSTALLPQPETVAGYYRDIAVLAFPPPARRRSEDALPHRPYRLKNGLADDRARPRSPLRRRGTGGVRRLPADAVIDRRQIVDLTGRLGKDGRLAWDVPAGQVDHAAARLHADRRGQRPVAAARARGWNATSSARRPSTPISPGLMAKLIADVGPAAGKTLICTHIDSWEVDFPELDAADARGVPASGAATIPAAAAGDDRPGGR